MKDDRTNEEIMKDIEDIFAKIHSNLNNIKITIEKFKDKRK